MGADERPIVLVAVSLMAGGVGPAGGAGGGSADGDHGLSAPHTPGSSADPGAVGRTLLRRLAAEALALAPHAVLLAHDAAGRPIVAAPAGTGLRCSLAHAGRAVVAAVARGCAVGVDVEPVDPRRADLETVSRFLDAGEAERLAALHAAEQPRAVALAWTRLEAEAKGRGLALDRLRGQVPGGIATELELGPHHVGTLWTDREATIHRTGIGRTGG